MIVRNDVIMPGTSPLPAVATVISVLLNHIVPLVLLVYLPFNTTIQPVCFENLFEYTYVQKNL